jgi:hypothetical protein
MEDKLRERPIECWSASAAVTFIQRQYFVRFHPAVNVVRDAGWVPS